MITGLCGLQRGTLTQSCFANEVESNGTEVKVDFSLLRLKVWISTGRLIWSHRNKRLTKENYKKKNITYLGVLMQTGKGLLLSFFTFKGTVRGCEPLCLQNCRFEPRVWTSHFHSGSWLKLILKKVSSVEFPGGLMFSSFSIVIALFSNAPLGLKYESHAWFPLTLLCSSGFWCLTVLISD